MLRSRNPNDGGNVALLYPCYLFFAKLSQPFTTGTMKLNTLIEPSRSTTCGLTTGLLHVLMLVFLSAPVMLILSFHQQGRP
ncbi:hypothetical protein F5146DRAFT_1043211 [Armillaria mellea]|nr:hypothetical protein F5146DRAFT_1043211 [Armillaria mellea]